MRKNAVIVGAVVGGAALWLYSQQGIKITGWAQGASDAVTAVKNTILEGLGMRGIRNNNPGNIRHSATKWQGQSATQTDSAFVQFETPEYGIRALSKVLDTYSKKYNLNTVRGIINRYAPPSENITGAYVSAVAGALGMSPDQAINVTAVKAQLVAAIIKHENGLNPYALATINSGVTMA